MKKLNYQVLMALSPTKYETKVNQLGQIVDFYEHPLHGDEYPVIAVIETEKAAYCTDFYDCEDFYDNSEYMPVYMHGTMDCAFNFDL
jgi:hypothetical protein